MASIIKTFTQEDSEYKNMPISNNELRNIVSREDASEMIKAYFGEEISDAKNFPKAAREMLKYGYFVNKSLRQKIKDKDEEYIRREEEETLDDFEELKVRYGILNFEEVYLDNDRFWNSVDQKLEIERNLERRSNAT